MATSRADGLLKDGKIEVQTTLVASPRNHLNLLNRLVVSIQGPVEDSGQIAVEVDFQLSPLVRPQFDPVDVSGMPLPYLGETAPALP